MHIYLVAKGVEFLLARSASEGHLRLTEYIFPLMCHQNVWRSLTPPQFRIGFDLLTSMMEPYDAAAGTCITPREEGGGAGEAGGEGVGCLISKMCQD